MTQTQPTNPVKQPTGTRQLPNPKAHHNIPGAIVKLEAALDRTKLPDERDKLVSKNYLGIMKH